MLNKSKTVPGKIYKKKKTVFFNIYFFLWPIWPQNRLLYQTGRGRVDGFGHCCCDPYFIFEKNPYFKIDKRNLLRKTLFSETSPLGAVTAVQYRERERERDGEYKQRPSSLGAQAQQSFYLTLSLRFLSFSLVPFYMYIYICWTVFILSLLYMMYNILCRVYTSCLQKRLVSSTPDTRS